MLDLQGGSGVGRAVMRGRWRGWAGHPLKEGGCLARQFWTIPWDVKAAAMQALLSRFMADVGGTPTLLEGLRQKCCGLMRMALYPCRTRRCGIYPA